MQTNARLGAPSAAAKSMQRHVKRVERIGPPSKLHEWQSLSGSPVAQRTKTFEIAVSFTWPAVGSGVRRRWRKRRLVVKIEPCCAALHSPPTFACSSPDAACISALSASTRRLFATPDATRALRPAGALAASPYDASRCPEARPGRGPAHSQAGQCICSLAFSLTLTRRLRRAGFWPRTST